MTDIDQINTIMYLAVLFLVLCFSGHIIALYLLRLMATKVYALTCTKRDSKIIRIVNIRKKIYKHIVITAIKFYNVLIYQYAL